MSFSLTRKTDYALVALTELAHAYLGDGQPRSARDIAMRYRLPSQLLMKVLKELTRAGFLESRRGVRGGYSLARSPEEINLREVIEVLQGPVAMAMCHAAHDPSCTPCRAYQRCPISQPMRRVTERLQQFLDRIVLSQFVETRAESGV